MPDKSPNLRQNRINLLQHLRFKLKLSTLKMANTRFEVEQSPCPDPTFRFFRGRESDVEIVCPSKYVFAKKEF